MTTTLQRLNELGFTVPTPPLPVANYVPCILCGNELRTSGQIPMLDGVLQFKGAVPSSQNVTQATQAAQLCALNTIAVASQALDGDLDRIQRVLQIRVFICSEPLFEDHSTIANGASDLMVAVFGDAGRHTRVAVGSVGLPLGATVEVEAVFEVQTNA